MSKAGYEALASEIGIPIEVSHFPPGTSKWSKIEHRLFSQISKNWRGRPLESLAVIVSLIASTTTVSGLKVVCHVDTANYSTGIKISEEELRLVNILKSEFHGEWNYTIMPNP